MNDVKTDTYELLNRVYVQGIKPRIVERKNDAYIQDPIFEIKRNRIIAETLKAIIRLNLEKNQEIVEKLLLYLEYNQNKDGSWNEIHPNYNQPSALITSIIGETLLMYFNKSQDETTKKIISLAYRYVLSQQKSPGYFIKSTLYTNDYLNVDATCGAFLGLYGETFSDDKSILNAEETAKHICEYQFSNGSFPYTINGEKNRDFLDIPCIHYQGVTLYYLSKINEVIKEEWLKQNLVRGAGWLSNVQQKNGQFDWSRSGLMFAYYLTGAYAFAFSSFMYASKWDKKYLKNAILCLNMLERNIDGLFLRWEKDSWVTFPLSVPVTLQSAFIGNSPPKQKFFRVGYGLYRQMARRRFSKKPDENMFNNLTKILGIHSSTIEPFSNYPDLFMTSEIFDCLSYSLSILEEGDYSLQ
jgi:hypothetical protein